MNTFSLRIGSRFAACIFELPARTVLIIWINERPHAFTLRRKPS